MKPKISEIQIIPIKPRDGLLGFCSIVFEDSFFLGSMGILTRPQGGYRISYPTRTAGPHTFNVFHPINKEVAERIEAAIIEKFESVWAKGNPGDARE